MILFSYISIVKINGDEHYNLYAVADSYIPGNHLAVVDSFFLPLSFWEKESGEIHLRKEK